MPGVRSAASMARAAAGTERVESIVRTAFPSRTVAVAERESGRLDVSFNVRRSLASKIASSKRPDWAERVRPVFEKRSVLPVWLTSCPASTSAMICAAREGCGLGMSVPREGFSAGGAVRGFARAEVSGSLMGIFAEIGAGGVAVTFRWAQLSRSGIAMVPSKAIVFANRQPSFPEHILHACHEDL